MVHSDQWYIWAKKSKLDPWGLKKRKNRDDVNSHKLKACMYNYYFVLWTYIETDFEAFLGVLNKLSFGTAFQFRAKWRWPASCSQSKLLRDVPHFSWNTTEWPRERANSRGRANELPWRRQSRGARLVSLVEKSTEDSLVWTVTESPCTEMWHFLPSMKCKTQPLSEAGYSVQADFGATIRYFNRVHLIFIGVVWTW